MIRDTIRYAGSPLKYSFSEVNQRKSVPVIEFNDKNDINIDLIELIPFRNMRIIKGPIAQLLNKDVYNIGNRDDYISAIITDDDYIVDAIGKLRKIYKNILKLEYKNSRTVNENNCINNCDEDIKTKSPFELFKDFYYEQNNVKLDDGRERMLLKIIKEVSDEAD